MTVSHPASAHSPTSHRKKMPKKTVAVVGALAISAGTLSFLQLDDPYALPAPGSISAEDTRDVPFVLQAAQAISIKNRQFDPSMMHMATGDTVTWTNREENGESHNITSTADNGSTFRTPADVPPGGTFSFTPSSPGTYDYHCSIHPGTVGTLDVTGDASAPPPEEPPPPSDPAPPPPPEDPPSESGSILETLLDLLTP